MPPSTTTTTTAAPGCWICAPLCTGPIAGCTYNYTISSLSANTVYQYRAYMVVCGCEYYGNTYEIATSATPTCVPTVCTGIGILDSINPSTQIGVNGNCISCKGVPATINEYGVLFTQNAGYATPTAMCYDNYPTYVNKRSLCDDAVTNPYFPASVIYNMTGLSPNTMTYYRAFAKNNAGYAYGTIKCIQTANVKEINLCRNLCTGTDGVSYGTTRQYYPYSTPAMVAGECYCVCLYVPIGLVPSLFGSGSYASAGVVCNSNPLCFVCVTNTACNNANLSFTFKYGDQVLITEFACVNALGCGGVGGGAKNCVCVNSITSICGSFTRGACYSACSYTG